MLYQQRDANNGKRENEKDRTMTLNIKRSAAAYKAWDTRKAQAQAQKRTAAALKAWATIRARKAARSAAAFQAWDTRDAA